MNLVKGDEVKLTTNIYSFIGGSIALSKKSTGKVRSSNRNSNLIEVNFNGRNFWFLKDGVSGNYYKYAYRAYPPVSILEKVDKGLEGSTFTILEDQGHGKFLVQRNDSQCQK